MKGDISAAIDLVNLNPALGEQLARSDNVGFARIAAQGDDRRVFDKEQHVPNAIPLAKLNQSFLQAQSSSVIAMAEIEDGDHLPTRIQRARAVCEIRRVHHNRRRTTPRSMHKAAMPSCACSGCCRIWQEPASHGELVKKIATCILMLLLSLSLSIPAAARTSANSANRAAQKNAKKAAKRNARQQKKDRKMSQKATKDWKKHHHAIF
jgi:hypothetical protein